MAEILSQEEIDALLSAVSYGEEVEVESESAKVERIINTYDFRHPARVSKDQLRTLQNLHDNFARLLSATFSTLQRSVIEVTLVSVDQITYSEFIMSLSSPSCTYVFRMEPLDGVSVVDFSQSVVFSFVDRLFGGRGSSISADREITWIEKSVMNNIINRTLRDLERTWERILPLECNVEMLETNPEFVQVVPASETVVLISFELKSDNVNGLINLCYPYITIEPIALRLGGQNLVSSAKEVPKEELIKNRKRIELFDANVKAILGEATVSVSDLVDLKVGDIVCYDRGVYRRAPEGSPWAAGKYFYIVECKEESIKPLPITDKDSFDDLVKGPVAHHEPNAPDLSKGYDEVEIEWEGQPLKVLVPKTDLIPWILPPEVAERLAKKNCKRCYGRGIEGYAIPEEGGYPFTCRKNGCTYDNFEKVKSLIASNKKEEKT